MPYRKPEQIRAYERRRYRRVTAERIAAGLCPTCGQRPPAPDRRLCDVCSEQRRRAERARYARAKAEGRVYGGKSAEAKRRAGRANSKKRYDARRAAGMCTRCGKQEPVEGSTVCEQCRDRRRAGEHEQWSARRARRQCGKCGAPTDGAARCDSCAASQTCNPEVKRAAALLASARARVLHRLRRVLPGRSTLSELRTPVMGTLGRASRAARISSPLPRDRDRDRSGFGRLGEPRRGPGLPGVLEARSRHSHCRDGRLGHGQPHFVVRTGGAAPSPATP